MKNGHVGTIQHIYLIDDEDDSHFVTRLVLRKAGFTGTLTCFSNAMEGFAALRTATEPPDLLLVDINMPHTNGFDLLRECERTGVLPNGRTLVAVFSGSNRQLDMDTARHMGCVDTYVEKTLSVERFAELIHQYERRA